MKKILWVTLEFPPIRGGVAVYIKQLSRELGQDSVTILTQKTPANSDFDDTKEPYTIIRKPLLWPKLLWPRWTRAWWHIWRAIASSHAHILMTSHVLPLGYVLMCIGAIKKIPYWINLHGLDLQFAKRSRWKRYWLRVILKHAALVVVNSEFTRQELEKLETVPAERVLVVYPAPDVSTLPTSELTEKTRYAYALDGKKILLSVCRLVKRKGIDNVLRILPRVLAEVPQAVYVIAGDGPELKRIEAITSELHLQNSVRVLGAVSDETRAALYNLADAFIMPTVKDEHDVEGFGIVYLEAAWYGVPVIASDNGGVREAVIHGQTGLLVAHENETELVDAIVTILRNKETGDALGKNAASRVRAEFNWQDQAAKIKALLL